MLKKYKWISEAVLTIIACFLSTLSFAGENRFSGHKVDVAGMQVSNQAILNETFSNYEIYRIDRASIYNYIQSSSYYKEFSLKLGDKEWNFELEPFDIRSEDYQMMIAANEGVKAMPKTPVSIYRGIADDDPNQRVVFQITEDRMFGFIKKKDERIYIEQINKHDRSAEDDLFIVYKNGDFNNQFLSQLKCDVENNQVDISVQQEETSTAACKLTEYAIAADWKMTRDYGGVKGSENNVLLLLSMIQEEYDPLEIQYVVIRAYLVEEENADPFWPDNDDMDDGLPNFRAWATGGGFGTTKFDVASLWSTREWCSTSNGNCGVAGRAWLNTICSSSRVNVLQNFTQSQGLSATIQAHENGHTFGANHSSDGDGTIMQPTASASATGWTTTSKNEILTGSGKSCISGCNVAPYVDFDADLTVTCNGTIAFTDKTQLDPTSWSWNFGDGNTSTEQNPTHTYTSSGTYTVQLTATNTYGPNSESKTAYVKVTLMDQLATVDAGTGCTGGTRTLTATPANSGSIEWYDAEEGGTLLHSGNTYDPTVLSTTTFYAVEVSDLSVQHVGPDYQQGSTRPDDRDDRYLSFDVYNEALLKSVQIVSDFGGQHTIEMTDNSGAVLASKVINLAAGVSRAELNFKLTPGTGYKLKVSGFVGDLYKSTGVKFPFTIKNVLSITTGSAGSYYYFYDWEVRTGCFTERVPVVAEACPSSIVENGIDFKLYPNPSQGIYHLEISSVPGDHVFVSVYNVLGEKVRNINYEINTTVFTEKLDLTDLPDGAYFLKLEAGNNATTYQKIVKH